MKNTIKCKECGAEIEVSEVLTHQIEEQVRASIGEAHKKELADARKVAEEEIGKGLEEERARNKELSTQLGELLEEVRKLRRKDEERDLEMKRKLLEEEEKIRQDARKNFEDEHELKDLENDKKLKDALRQVGELQQKMQQGSQQSQGETLELELEEKLKAEFSFDTITEVKKGQRGADILQGVVDKLGRTCGFILWESKNAQWSNDWLGKLKEDQRQAKADLAVLVSVNLPVGTETFSYKDGVWIVGWKYFIALAFTLRFSLISLYHERYLGVGKNEKMEVLYQYITSVEFTHRIEAIIEAFGGLQEEVEREKRWFQTKWARQEKQLRKVIDHTHGMYGDLQGVTGKSLPEIKTLKLEAGEVE
ncbi:MAG: DUF2130 domain-containing protein [bacterium]|nr:DUF2130 domain-containing protein [bacterium]